MNTLPQDLIRIIRSYDNHPCGDMLNKFSCERFENCILLKPRSKHIPNTKFTTKGLFGIRDNGTEEDERLYESEVIERNICNKFSITSITEFAVRQLKDLNYETFL